MAAGVVAGRVGVVDVPAVVRVFIYSMFAFISVHAWVCKHMFARLCGGICVCGRVIVCT